MFLAGCVILNTTFNPCIADSRVRPALNLKIIGVQRASQSCLLPAAVGDTCK